MDDGDGFARDPLLGSEQFESPNEDNIGVASGRRALKAKANSVKANSADPRSANASLANVNAANVASGANAKQHNGMRGAAAGVLMHQSPVHNDVAHVTGGTVKSLDTKAKPLDASGDVMVDDDTNVAVLNSMAPPSVEARVPENGQDQKRSIGERLPNPFRQRSRRPGKFHPAGDIIGSSKIIKALRERIDLCAQSDGAVMITGETGVGKELVAKRLHENSHRAMQRFLPINLSAMPDTMVPSALFGHEKGSFTGAHADRDGALVAADGGTLFLDEIGDLPKPLQTHLLRCLEDQTVSRLGGFSTRKVDVRLITATNVAIGDAVRKRQFRDDLYYRINVLPIVVPPLRERGDDVVEIAEHFILTEAKKTAFHVKLSSEAADRLKSYSFPGNIRELRSVILQALVLCFHSRGDTLIREEDIVFMPPVAHTDKAGSGNTVFTDQSKAPVFDSLPNDRCTFLNDSDSLPSTHGLPPTQGLPSNHGGQIETLNLKASDASELISRWLTLRALKSTGGNVSHASKLCGRSRSTIHALVNSIEDKDFDKEYEALRHQVKALLNCC
ncbi:MAG: sigma 54-interacting transcriptional regulator [Pseudomonadota bacterium]